MFKIEKMEEKHINEVYYNIELDCFTLPWSKNNLLNEVTNNKDKIYFVVLNEEEKAIAYAGMWIILDEGHITNIAVNSKYRNKGIGKILMKKLIESAIENNLESLTLEVRESNLVAQRLYSKFAFMPLGVRKEYYSDTMENAIIMWKFLNEK